MLQEAFVVVCYQPQPSQNAADRGLFAPAAGARQYGYDVYDARAVFAFMATSRCIWK